MQQKLLAKGLKYGELTLEQHLKDTAKAAEAIFKDRILRNWCCFFKVKDADKFLKHLQIAALFHDMGKANAEFAQLMVPGATKFKQTLRHEWISALILHFDSVRKWLESSELDLEIITAAVLCHHLQASPKKKGYVDAFGKPRSLINEIQLYLDHPQVKAILHKIGQITQVNGLPELPDKWIIGDSIWKAAYSSVINTADEFVDFEDNPERCALLLAIKAGLIAADSVASGIFRVQSSEAIEQWVNDTLHQEAITPKEIEEKILQPRYRQIENKTEKPFKLKSFQEKAVDLSSRLLLLSGCGTGKTIFAYKWQQGVLKNRQVGHIIFLYPTRGTATEGFKDYVSWAPEADASLLTGTAIYELKTMAENPSESTSDKDFTTEERLYALGFWDKRFFSATVDQFLSFLTHNYTGICLLPVLADSVVVIDEVHSFSRSMFDNLVSFLKYFDLPVLCMTATLPPSRKEELVNQNLSIFPTTDRSELQELEVAENRPRYIIHTSDYDNAFEQAITAYQNQDRKRVLWVVNTVDRCREIANKLEKTLNSEILTYHSRFRLKDRQARHQDTVKAFQTSQAFQESKNSVIAVTTQVCEMSLDLDADILITELAPISSLVQRFGRSNRHGLIPHAQIWVYEPLKDLPYKKEELESARIFMTEVVGEVSQQKLVEKLEKYASKERNADGSSKFVDGGYWATSEPFRETEDYCVNAVLDKDVDCFLKLRETKNPDAEGYILPVPKKFARFKSENRPEKLPKYLAIASSEFYCEKRGFGE